MATPIKNYRDFQAVEILPTRLIDNEGERLIVSNLLARSEFCRAVLPQLSVDLFAVEQYRRTFLALTDAVENGHTGLDGVYRRVLDLGKTPDELGLPTLSSLAYDNSIQIANPDSWIRSLRRHEAERRAWRAAEKLRLSAESGNGVDIAAAREELRKIEADLEPARPNSGTIADMIGAVGLDSLLTPGEGVIASPWPKLTELTNGGLRNGEFWIVGARPGVGKTLALLNWLLTASASGHKAKLFSLEMPSADLIRRAISAEGRVSHGALRRGDLSAEWRRRVVETLDRIGTYPLEIIDNCRTLGAIAANVSAAASKQNLSLVAVDYLGLIEPEGRHENRNQEVSFISRRLKLLAMDRGLPILAAHQLNRGNETESRRPALSDLRDSGSLEQDADAVILMDSPAKRAKRVTPDAPPDRVDLIIAKQRNGPTDYSIELRLDASHCRLEQA